MIPSHFGIYKSIPSVDGRLFVMPEASTVSEEQWVLDILNEKAESRFGDGVECACDLIMTDCTLIDDISGSDCYFLLLASKGIAAEGSGFWDPRVDLSRYFFIGWTIDDYVGGNYAFCDGYFPVHGLERRRPYGYDLEIVDGGAINGWGLIKDEVFLDYYLGRNNSVCAIQLGNDGSSDVVGIGWKPFGVFCDKFTHGKLMALRKSIESKYSPRESKGSGL